MATHPCRSCARSWHCSPCAVRCAHAAAQCTHCRGTAPAACWCLLAEPPALPGCHARRGCEQALVAWWPAAERRQDKATNISTAPRVKRKQLDALCSANMCLGQHAAELLCFGKPSYGLLPTALAESRKPDSRRSHLNTVHSVCCQC